MKALPRVARTYNPDKLKEEYARLKSKHMNTAVVHRKHVLAVAVQIRRELRA